MVNFRLLPAVLSALLWAPASHASAPDEFVGRAQIQVLNSTDVRTASLSDRVGCLNARGELTLNDCAVFTRSETPTHTLFTSAGNCTFQNPNMPRNTDSIYGQNSHAFFCGEADWDQYDEYYYTIGRCAWKPTMPLPALAVLFGGSQQNGDRGRAIGRCCGYGYNFNAMILENIVEALKP
ncbi:predicted protein [Chaetomium globosum CBS 148.51]|uniref:Ecp2 effector protein domain-containing protein n=1 Tax=Chaetomium globosum (strain ATCC 6205 / CBS 148.51 / DSM 1962 / NBRC 6347 / NRRL 1970) TaxID=306901 RepID=Q2HBX7_CHAGB|nr:uncharacterized protein CHGG_02277 [Chaetomium globosum CBS 148.51]EAQ90342.1 predicted protein [Chaetomium globosum CBS 148.51]